MVTGDHPATAKAIGRQLGIIDSDEPDVVLGKQMPDFEKLSAADKSRWASAKIFARVSPKQKLDLIRVFQERKAIVGMTGDGVNDAPALKKADIGIAMGKRGTQVAQDVADMVLRDDSFASIVVAIRQGRAIFDNIRKFVIYLLSCNLSELFVIVQHERTGGNRHRISVVSTFSIEAFANPFYQPCHGCLASFGFGRYTGRTRCNEEKAASHRRTYY